MPAERSLESARGSTWPSTDPKGPFEGPPWPATKSGLLEGFMVHLKCFMGCIGPSSSAARAI